MRGELFTTGRYYLSGSVLVEMTPLLQFIGTYSLAQNFDLPASFNLPAGPDGSVFGGTLYEYCRRSYTSAVERPVRAPRLILLKTRQ